MGYHGLGHESAEDLGDGDDVESGHVKPLTHLGHGHLTSLETADKILRVCHQLLHCKRCRRGSPSLPVVP